MIFNRYVLLLVAGYQSFGEVSASRDLKGHKKHGNPHERILNSEYDALVSLLNESYEHSCSVYVTGELPAKPSTFVDCRRPGGFATMTAEGGSDPIPKRLRVCEYGSDMKETCHRVRFTGDEQKDLKKAKELIDGHRHLSESSSFYDEILAVLEQTFDHRCQVKTTGFGKAETLVSCVRPGAEVHFTSEGTPAGGNPTPLSVKLCSIGSEMKETCKTLTFASGVAEDIEEVKRFLDGRIRTLSNPPIVGTDYQMLVQLLNGVYDDNCHVYTTGAGNQAPKVSVACTRAGGEAVLSAVGATEPNPKSLQVCEVGANMKKTCRSISLNGQTEHDLPAARTLLGVRD